MDFRPAGGAVKRRYYLASGTPGKKDGRIVEIPAEQKVIKWILELHAAEIVIE